MTTKRILLVRHGQTDWNLEERWQGSIDVPLNEVGLKQAQSLATHLRDGPITAIYSSDLKRAHQTASAVAAVKGLPVHGDPRLREIHLGDFQGLTHTELVARFPQEMTLMRQNYMEFVFPGGESRRAMQNRAYEALASIVERETGPEILVVSHGGTIRVLLLKLFEDDEKISRLSISNTSITVLETDGERWTLVEAMTTPHLEKMHRNDIDTL
jgi:2,3-bisphosphoglycerate-dependent phosphoglycerate mutase